MNVEKKGPSDNFKRMVLVAIIIISILNIVANFVLYQGFIGFSRAVSGSASQAEISFFVEASTAEPAAPTAPAPSGGAAPYLAPPISNFIIVPDLLEISAIPEQEKKKIFKVKNIGQTDLEIDLSLQGISDISSLDTDKLIINKGEEDSFVLTINPSKEGIYAGKIILKSGELEKEVQVIVGVKKGKKIFDPDVIISEEDESFTSGNDFNFFISLEKIGTFELMEVNLDYSIKDFKGNILHSESEIMEINESISFNKEFKNLNLDEGDYLLAVEISYLDGFDTVSARFSVIEKEKDEITRLIFIFSILILALLAIIISIVKYKKFGGSSKNK